MIGRSRPQRCGASGWRVAAVALGGGGVAACPRCGTLVATTLERGGRVRVITTHAKPGADGRQHHPAPTEDCRHG